MAKQSTVRTLSAGSIGNFGEIYDFAVFGFSVPILAAHFFPGSDRTAALLSTFAVYAVAFFARPVGGLMFGVIADKIGRVKVMATTVWLMALGTAVIGLLPTYARIGIAAPVLLVVCRIAQGLALGGETTGTTSFILESAPDDRRGGWIGLTLIFSHLPNALVAGLLIGLQLAAGATAYADWVWRVPFLAGGLIGIVGFWLRRNLDEPDEFKQATRKTHSKNPLRTAIREGGLKGMLNVAMIQPIQTVGSYLLLGFMYTFLVRVAKLDPTSALFTNAASVVVLSFMIPLGGMLSDRFGRKPILTFGAAWLAFAAYPGVYLAATGTITGALLGQLLLVVGVGLYGGACFVAAPEFFPTSFRATGHAISYQVTVAVFGGTTPLIGTLLVQAFGSPLAPAYYVAAVAVACLILTQFVPETKGVSLRTATSSTSGERSTGAVHEAR
ncbi:MFS transporter [Paraburkholderia tuberum]|uniref:MFS transporter, MHS family, proline/betaine transporter n=1 Tax=Paraburkholderia tuberum TaxID=157910 RepID=A0A1H1KGI3_9BURK|nr:MFS transporter [Paraburkholderia tuberum]SDR61356.1 MFS transporter, MHS family, proline/betaine transporter [Paraburkholderia tuberum]